MWINQGEKLGGFFMDSQERKMPRTKKRMLVHLRTADSDKKRSAFTTNIGPSGLFLVTSQREEIGQHLYVELEIPDVGEIEISAQVIWQRQVQVDLRSMESSGYGVKILEAPECWYQFLYKEMSRQDEK
jgi:Tfp pilus assembly protein PilZ